MDGTRAPAMGPYTVERVSDLAQLSDAELRRCLMALAQDVRRRRIEHEAAIRDGLRPENAPLEYQRFVWLRRGEVVQELPNLRPDTPIEALPLGARVKTQLHLMNVLCLEDLSAVERDELLAARAIGATTVRKPRGWLLELGLDFQAPLDERRRQLEQSRAHGALNATERARALQGLGDSAAIGELGLSSRVLGRALARGYRTLGELRALTPKMLAVQFGPQEARALYQALEATGRGLASNPTPLQLWVAGLVPKEALDRPESADTPVAELRPWLGAAVGSLARHGVDTLGQLVACVRTGQVATVPGIGEMTARRIERVLELEFGQACGSSSFRAHTGPASPFPL